MYMVRSPPLVLIHLALST